MPYLKPCTCVRALLMLPLFLFFSCGGGEAPVTENEPDPTRAATIDRSDFGTTADGQAVEKYALTNAAGMSMEVITYGGIITSLTAPDGAGNYENVVLGYDSVAQYERNNPYFGAIIGRYGNRIAGGKFSLEGETYTLETNDGPNHLHGGARGFDKVVWTAEILPSETDPALRLSYVSPDGAGGYPGQLTTTVTYTLTEDNSLDIAYAATTDQPTIVNLTQHTYFNLSGDAADSTILDHVLMLDADRYLPVDNTFIPTGELAPVEGTPFDFTEPKAIGRDIGTADEQLKRGQGYDHCWVLDEPGTGVVATLHHPASGRFMEIRTEEPAIQFYSGNFLDGTLPVPGGGTYALRSGLCLETQHYPDSPNQPEFPSVVLLPGDRYETSTSYHFTTK